MIRWCQSIESREAVPGPIEMVPSASERRRTYLSGAVYCVSISLEMASWDFVEYRTFYPIIDVIPDFRIALSAISRPCHRRWSVSEETSREIRRGCDSRLNFCFWYLRFLRRRWCQSIESREAVPGPIDMGPSASERRRTYLSGAVYCVSISLGMASWDFVEY